MWLFLPSIGKGSLSWNYKNYLHTNKCSSFVVCNTHSYTDNNKRQDHNTNISVYKYVSM